MITDDQWDAMRHKAGAGECSMPEPKPEPQPRRWWQGWKLGGDVGMLSRWTGEQGKKDMAIPVWKKIYARIFIRKEF